MNRRTSGAGPVTTGITLTQLSLFDDIAPDGDAVAL
jgi:hypothetical protein